MVRPVIQNGNFTQEYKEKIYDPLFHNKNYIGGNNYYRLVR